jgi:predicted Zn-dependent peptidase
VIAKKIIVAAVCASVSLLMLNQSANAAVRSADMVQSAGSLSGGGTYIIHRDITAPTAAVELWYRAPGAGYDNANPGISRLAITAIAASAPPHGTSLSELVARLGGSLSINVYPDIAMVGVSVPSWQAQPMIRALTAAYFSPSISDNGLKAALRDSAIAAAEGHFDSDRILQDTLFQHIFSAGPAHFPAVPASSQDFAKIPVTAVKAFAARAFRRSNAVLTLTGSVDPKWIGDVVSSNAAPSGIRASDMQPDAPIDSTLSNANIDLTQTSQVGGIGFAWIGPPISDEKAATAMDFIADYAFDGEHGTLAATLRKAKSGAFLNGQFITLHNPGVLLVTVSGAGSQALRSAVLDAAADLQHPLERAAFDAARTAFEYHILSQTQTPPSRADNFGWYAVEGDAAYAPGDFSADYLQAAQSLDAQYVAEVARKYLQHPAIVQLLTTARRGTTT